MSADTKIYLVVGGMFAGIVLGGVVRNFWARALKVTPISSTQHGTRITVEFASEAARKTFANITLVCVLAGFVGGIGIALLVINW